MDYNDFPILNNNEYLFLNSKYQQENPFDRETTVGKILSKLSSAENICYCLGGIYNKIIEIEITSTLKTINKIIGNLCSIFNIKFSPPKAIKQFNIFNLIKSLNEIIKSFFTWTQNEFKQYYKSIAYNSAYDLINNLDLILSSMGKSKIDFYKHM